MASTSSVAPLIKTFKNFKVFNAVLQGLLQTFAIFAQKILLPYEAHLQPISLVRNACLVKYHSKLSSLGFHKRTMKFLRSWSSHQRLKRGSFFRHVVSGHLVASSIEYHILSQIIDPSEGLDGFDFHVDLSMHVIKQKELPCYLKQLDLERTNNVPKDAVHMYTDGSKLCRDCSGSSIYEYFTFKRTGNSNPERNSGILLGISFRAFAILEGLNSSGSLSWLHDIWIFSDRRSAIQHLVNWHNVKDRTARAGASETATPATPLTYLELFSKYKANNKAIWMIQQVHPWHQSKYPGGSLVQGSSKRHQPALTRVLSAPV
ncbi:RNase H domain-containing protein [Trichonephila clavipes]|nr:RNase H domain-containing protein [Trichonephila clavipes]